MIFDLHGFLSFRWLADTLENNYSPELTDDFPLEFSNIYIGLGFDVLMRSIFI